MILLTTWAKHSKKELWHDPANKYSAEQVYHLEQDNARPCTAAVFLLEP